LCSRHAATCSLPPARWLPTAPTQPVTGSDTTWEGGGGHLTAKGSAISAGSTAAAVPWRSDRRASPSGPPVCYMQDSMSTSRSACRQGQLWLVTHQHPRQS
jgi:hypothetical protein